MLQRIFKVSIWFFVVSLVSVIAFLVAPEIPDDPSYAKYTGLKALINLVKIIDAFDLPITILSAISSGITYIIKYSRGE